MTRRIVTQRCAYCGQAYAPERRTSRYCSGDCRVRAHRALHADEVEAVSLRREAWSAERRAATGYGHLSRRETYEADLRVRAAAGIQPCRWCRYQVRREVERRAWRAA